MGLIECTSDASFWRGYEYFKENRVRNLSKINDTQYQADVVGTMQEPYKVSIDMVHPRKSKCNCPHADGRRIICKHMMAVYFSANPRDAQRVFDRAASCDTEEDEWEDQLFDRVCNYIQRMKKSELQQTLVEILFEGPDWQFERFLREHDLDE